MIGLVTTELIKPRGPWRTVEQVEVAVLEYIDWFNHLRLYEACESMPALVWLSVAWPKWWERHWC